MAVYAFCRIWDNNYFYNLPLFSLGPLLAKVNRDKTKAVIVVPDWSTQYWYPANADDQPRATIFSDISKKYDSSRQILRELFTTSKAAVSGNQCNDATVKILETSWRKSTDFKYNNYIKHRLCYSKTMGKIGVTHVF